MARHKGVVDALIGLGEAGEPLELPQGGKQLPTAGQRLVDVALVPYVEYQPVCGRIKNAVDGYRQLHRSQIRGQMSAGAGYLLHQKLPQLAAQQLRLFSGQALYVRRRMYCFQDQRVYAPFFSDRDAARS